MHTTCIHLSIRFEWDAAKARENLRKHRVDFADAVIALEDENALTVEDREQSEIRFKTLGMGPELNVLLVVHAMRSRGAIRIISARRASRRQINEYFKGIPHE